MILAFASTGVLAAPPAVVVVDLEARRQGYALALEDLLVDDALPIDVLEGEQVEVVDPDGGRHPLDVASGEAWIVSGPAGEAWMARIGTEVRADVLLVRGDADAVAALARALDAKVTPEGDRWWVAGPDVLFRAPWVDGTEVDRIDEVSYVAVEPPRAAPAPPVGAPPPVGSGRLQPLGGVMAIGQDTRTGTPVVARSFVAACGALRVSLAGHSTAAAPEARADWDVCVAGFACRRLVEDATAAEATALLERRYCSGAPAR